MPKRRMTAARKRQIAQWQKKGAQSRVKRWSAGELAEPRKIPKAISQWDKSFRVPFYKAGTASPLTEAEAKAYQKELRIPTGKNILLVHRSPKPEISDKIVKEQRFRPVGKKRTVYFTTYKSLGSFNRDYGKNKVAVRVPRKFAKIDGASKQLWAGDSVAFGVNLKHLRGRKIRRL